MICAARGTMTRFYGAAQYIRRCITAIGLMAAVVNVGHQAYIPRRRTKTAGEHVAINAGHLRTNFGRKKCLLDSGRNIKIGRDLGL